MNGVWFMAQATLDDAREQYLTAKALDIRGVTAHQTLVTRKAAFDRAQAELLSAQADRSLAEAQLDLTQAVLEKACICSPIKGVVLDRAVDPERPAVERMVVGRGHHVDARLDDVDGREHAPVGERPRS